MDDKSDITASAHGTWRKMEELFNVHDCNVYHVFAGSTRSPHTTSSKPTKPFAPLGEILRDFHKICHLKVLNGISESFYFCM